MPSSILLIDVSPGECELFRQALTQIGREIVLYAEHDVDAGLHFLLNHSRLPWVILLDWHLRKTRGNKFLESLRADAHLATIPVVIFTTSDDLSDMTAGYGHGANGYVVNPGTFDRLFGLPQISVATGSTGTG
jgi:DNA-binding response OmpR family regulator